MSFYCTARVPNVSWCGSERRRHRRRRRLGERERCADFKSWEQRISRRTLSISLTHKWLFSLRRWITQPTTTVSYFGAPLDRVRALLSQKKSEHKKRRLERGASESSILSFFRDWKRSWISQSVSQSHHREREIDSSREKARGRL